MTQLIASYELAIGCENTASIIPFTRLRAGFFLPGENHERSYSTNS